LNGMECGESLDQYLHTQVLPEHGQASAHNPWLLWRKAIRIGSGRVCRGFFLGTPDPTISTGVCGRGPRRFFDFNNLQFRVFEPLDQPQVPGFSNP
jgi:hypothetical protein